MIIKILVKQIVSPLVLLTTLLYLHSSSRVTQNFKDRKLKILIFPMETGDYKSVNLQYITLSCSDDATNESLTKSLMFQVFFFIQALLL